MRISPAKLYEDKYMNELNNSTAIPGGQSVKVDHLVRDKQNQANMSGHDKILSKNERDFFIKLFPENSEQLENHTLFNQSGRLQTPGINKGMIVDGRI